MAAPTVNTGVPSAPGVFTRASSGLVRQVRTDDVMFYGWQQIALGYIIFIVAAWQDRKSTRLNSSHANISYAVFCLKKKSLALHPYTRPHSTHDTSTQTV